MYKKVSLVQTQLALFYNSKSHTYPNSISSIIQF